MIRVFVLYSEQPDPDAAYYFEYEFPDREAWKHAQDGLRAGAEDAKGLGIPFRVYVADIE